MKINISLSNSGNYSIPRIAWLGGVPMPSTPEGPQRLSVAFEL